jgi:hypothetical protein
MTSWYSFSRHIASPWAVIFWIFIHQVDLYSFVCYNSLAILLLSMWVTFNIDIRNKFSTWSNWVICICWLLITQIDLYSFLCFSTWWILLQFLSIAFHIGIRSKFSTWSNWVICLCWLLITQIDLASCMCSFFWRGMDRSPYGNPLQRCSYVLWSTLITPHSWWMTLVQECWTGVGASWEKELRWDIDTRTEFSLSISVVCIPVSIQILR